MVHGSEAQKLSLKGRRVPTRLTVLSLCFLSTVICYVDRVNISVAIIPMGEELGWSQTDKGVVLSAFFYGYMVTQVLGGWMADRFGGKSVLAFGVIAWSLFTILTAPAATMPFFLLFLVRVGMGLGEGVNFPAIQNMIAHWMPAKERSRAASINVSGVPFGTVVALLLAPPIIVSFGWQAVFYVFGALGLVWIVFWHLLVTSDPADHGSVSADELAYINDNSAPLPKNNTIPFRKLLSKAPVWAIIVAHFCGNWGFYILLAWMPTYLNDALGVPLPKVGLYSIFPYITMFIMINAGGFLADGLIRVGLSVTLVRKGLLAVGFLGAATFFILLSSVSSALQATVYLSCALGSIAISYSSYLVNHLDIGPRYAGVLLGISNTVGTLPGVFGVAVTGLILDISGSWDAIFWITAGLYLIGVIVFCLFATGEKVFE